MPCNDPVSNLTSFSTPSLLRSDRERIRVRKEGRKERRKEGRKEAFCELLGIWITQVVSFLIGQSDKLRHITSVTMTTRLPAAWKLSSRSRNSSRPFRDPWSCNYRDLNEEQQTWRQISAAHKISAKLFSGIVAWQQFKKHHTTLFLFLPTWSGSLTAATRKRLPSNASFCRLTSVICSRTPSVFIVKVPRVFSISQVT